jgi:eukaryotic-like serine/threonine-protein kinase
VTPSLGDVPEDASRLESFTRDRLALFGKTVSWIALTFLVLSLVLHAANVMPFWRPGMESHLAATLIALSVWQIAKHVQLSESSLQALDTVGTLGMCVCLAVMGHRYAAEQPWGAFAGIFAVFHVTMARAIIVPSTAARTAAVTGLSFLGLVISQRLMPGPAPFDGAPSWLGVIPSLTWSGTVTMLATLASKVIYGLQERVFQARQLGQYTLEEKIGSGGMGEVYRASHAMLRRPTAVKLISGGVSDEQLRRFEKEVQLTAQLTHPNTISIYDYGRTPEGIFYYAMELLDGLTLEQLVQRHGPQPATRIVHILLQICGALREAHEAGLVHRDIKPANVILCFHGGLPDVVKVLDFGLVKQIATDAQPSHSNTGAIVGTPLFMSPEEISAPDSVGPQSDLYSVGAVAYFLLTGEPVFSGENVIQVCGHHLHTPPVPPSQRTSHKVPGDLETVVLACLAKQPSDRPPSAVELAKSLRQCADAGAWSESQARLWWDARDGTPASESPIPAQGETRTLRVDLERRSEART